MKVTGKQQKWPHSYISHHQVVFHPLISLLFVFHHLFSAFEQFINVLVMTEIATNNFIDTYSCLINIFRMDHQYMEYIISQIFHRNHLNLPYTCNIIRLKICGSVRFSIYDLRNFSLKDHNYLFKITINLNMNLITVVIK